MDPHGERVIGVENDAGESLGEATALDLVANLHRVRRKPEPPLDDGDASVLASNPKRGSGSGGGGPNLVELAHQQYYAGAPVSSAATPATVAREA